MIYEKFLFILNIIKKVIKIYFIESRNTKAEKKFASLLSRYKIPWDKRNRKIILTCIVGDYAMCIKLASASFHVAKRENSNIGLYSIATKTESFLYRNNRLWDMLYAVIAHRKLDKIFLGFGGKVVFRNVYNKKSDKIELVYQDIIKSLKSKDDILNIKLEGIPIGDLIYDTYLRFSVKPTINMDDPYLDKIIYQAVQIFFTSKEVFSKYDVKAIINSYTCYIHFGINVRLAIERNIPVYTVGSYNSLVHRVFPGYPSHHNNHFAYKYLFNKLNNQVEKINAAKQIFEKRFEGEIDAATSYMKQSAFSKNYNPALEAIDWPNTVVLLAHCFFDSPHIYTEMLFPDFYEWITFTIDRLNTLTNVKILVKPHPNGVEGNDEVFAGLEEKYFGSNVQFIDKYSSNRQLIDARPLAVITAYGTAASEFAYHDIPVISIHDNPFSAFDFTKVLNSKESYEEALLKIRSISVNIQKSEILTYYYMQHLHFTAGRDANWLKYNEPTSNKDDYLNDYIPLMEDSGYFEMVDSTLAEGFVIADSEFNDLIQLKNAI